MKYYFTLSLIAVMFLSCKDTESDQSSLTETSLRLDWITNMNFVGDIIGKQKFAASEGIDLKIEQASFGVDPIKMVITNQNDFGITSFENFLIANDKGADLVAIGLINIQNPTVFLSLQKEFDQLEDMDNLRVGLNPGGATENVYRLFFKENKIKNTTEIPTDYSISPLLNGTYDIRLAFAFVEPVELEQKEVNFKIIDPSNFGFNFPGRVYFAKREFITNNPDATQAFIKTMAKGLQYSIDNKSEAVNALKAYDKEVDMERESLSYDKGIKYFVREDENILTFDMALILNSSQKLVDLGLIKRFKLDDFDTTFIDNYYKNK